jgi:threonyl-tRNA synthetase
MSTRVPDGESQIVTPKNEAGLDTIRHSTAHLWPWPSGALPGTQVTIGPVIEHSFYYDFGTGPFSDEDLRRIEEKMQRFRSVICRSAQKWSREEAIAAFRQARREVQGRDHPGDPRR